MKNTLSFIGGGRITRIMLQAFSNRKAQFERIVVYDTNAEVLSSLKQQFPHITITETLQEVAKSEVVFIALHPPIIVETLDKIASNITESTSVVSLAPKITIEKIKAKLSTSRIARLIPNATSFINQGYNPVCFAADFSPKEKQDLMNVLELLGHTFEVAESKLEAYAILSAMLPTYFWFQWNELCELGLQMGLNEMESRQSVQETLKAAIDLLFDSQLTPSQVMDLIPVKPIGEHQQNIAEMYQTRLLALFEKIKA